MSEVSTEEGARVFKWDGSRIEGIDPDQLEVHDFRRPCLLTQSDLGQLGSKQHEFVQHLSARLSTFLRMECSLKIMKFGAVPFGKFTDSIKDPAYVSLFQMEPLTGIGILDISPPLCLVMADRILGGKGRVTESERQLTEIELALIEDVVELILGEWAQEWERDGWQIHSQCAGHESSGRFLQTSAPETEMVVLIMEAILGECMEQIQMAFPFSMIEPIVKKLRGEQRPIEAPVKREMTWRVPYNEIGVPVTAEWMVKEVALGEVLELKAGDVLKMPRELIQKTRVLLSNAPGFEGIVGIKDGYVAVQLTKQNLAEENL